MIRYLYIDDESEKATSPIIDMLKRSHKELDLTYQYPLFFSKQWLKMEGETYSGILLDFRLDQVASLDKSKVDFNALSLAQEFRTRICDGRLVDIPLILCSTASKMCNSFISDDASKNLFDLFVEKDSLDENQNEIARQMVSLANGYEQINNWRINKQPWHVLLNVEDKFFSSLNPSIWSNFDDDLHRHFTHKFARFFLKELIWQTGPLIDEMTLAARLGVNNSEKAEWQKLLSILQSLEYNGPFCKGWPRWWAKKLENWWKQQDNYPGILKNLSAKDRTTFLNRTFGLHFQPSEPIEKGYSDLFWTICLGTKKPLDPLDGLIAAGPDLKPWQEKPYISIKAALDRTGLNKGVRVHSIEKERFDEIKAAFIS